MKPPAGPVRGTVCPIPWGCDYCMLVVAVSRFLDHEVSDVAAAFGGKWGHDKVFLGLQPFGDKCCGTGHADAGTDMIEPDYRLAPRKPKPIPVMPSYEPLSPPAPPAPAEAEEGCSYEVLEEVPAAEPDVDADNGSKEEIPKEPEDWAKESDEGEPLPRRKLKGRRTCVQTSVDIEDHRVIPQPAIAKLTQRVIRDEAFC